MIQVQLKRFIARLGYMLFDILSIAISIITLAYAQTGSILFYIGGLTSGYLLVSKYVLILNKRR